MTFQLLQPFPRWTQIIQQNGFCSTSSTSSRNGSRRASSSPPSTTSSWWTTSCSRGRQSTSAYMFQIASTNKCVQGALLDSIQGGARLKKVAQINDRSAPTVG